MKTSDASVERWALVAITAVALVLALLLAAYVTSNAEDAALNAVRYTARISVTLFLLAFTASATAQLWPAAITVWQRRNRRYLGLSFALSHFVHLAAILSLRTLAPDHFASIPPPTWILGGLAYVFIAGMAVTSFDRTTRAIGPRVWKILHATGAHYIWLVFANSYISRAWTMPEYILPAVAVVAALALRGLARYRQRTKASSLARVVEGQR